MGRLRRDGNREEKRTSSTSQEDDLPDMGSHPHSHLTVRTIMCVPCFQVVNTGNCANLLRTGLRSLFQIELLPFLMDLLDGELFLSQCLYLGGREFLVPLGEHLAVSPAGKDIIQYRRDLIVTELVSESTHLSFVRLSLHIDLALETVQDHLDHVGPVGTKELRCVPGEGRVEARGAPPVRLVTNGALLINAGTVRTGECRSGQNARQNNHAYHNPGFSHGPLHTPRIESG